VATLRARPAGPAYETVSTPARPEGGHEHYPAVPADGPARTLRSLGGGNPQPRELRPASTPEPPNRTLRPQGPSVGAALPPGPAGPEPPSRPADLLDVSGPDATAEVLLARTISVAKLMVPYGGPSPLLARIHDRQRAGRRVNEAGRKLLPAGTPDRIAEAIDAAVKRAAKKA
jgi:hypothetical protein